MFLKSLALLPTGEQGTTEKFPFLTVEIILHKKGFSYYFPQEEQKSLHNYLHTITEEGNGTEKCGTEARRRRNRTSPSRGTPRRPPDFSKAFPKSAVSEIQRAWPSKW